MLKILAITVSLVSIANNAYACNSGDPSLKVVTSFDLYQGPGPWLNHPDTDMAALSRLGDFNSGGVVCIAQGLNRSNSPPVGWTWIYFKAGVRQYQGVAPTSAFEGG